MEWAGLSGAAVFVLLQKAGETRLAGDFFPAAPQAAHTGLEMADPKTGAVSDPVEKQAEGAGPIPVLPDLGRIVAALEPRRAEKPDHLIRGHSGEGGQGRVFPFRGRSELCREDRPGARRRERNGRGRRGWPRCRRRCCPRGRRRGLGQIASRKRQRRQDNGRLERDVRIDERLARVRR